MGLKKKTKKLLGTLEGVLEGPDYNKRLKKAKAFTKLIETLEIRRSKLKKAVSNAPKNSQRKALEDQIDLLDKQTQKAYKLLKTIEKKNE